MLNIVYIHGFLSSPSSYKAQITGAWLTANRPQVSFLCPELSSYPDETVQQLSAIFETLRPDETCIVGSSMGGFWATWLIEQRRAKKAVLINPAVGPQNFVEPLLGKPLKNYYSDAEYTLQPQHVDVLVACDLDLRCADAYWLMVQTGDETLPYELAVEKYRACKQSVESGGSHTFEGYENWLPEIVEFFET
ncbi:hypothetical protein P886_1842 [Alteromonadaceae bacterium 2753L.S.0a.02]|nr:hypothetical protein P886_1842 [Alteromonadaceae bacterium 2753L.S.0a.02]